MTSSGALYLMYHELELRGRKLCQREEGYVRYVLFEEDFRGHLAAVREAGFVGVSVGEALRETNRKSSSVVITFDDGCETDWIAAAPALYEEGFRATFYVVVGWLGRAGYLSNQNVRDLLTSGFEIGCHSMTHRYLSDLQPTEVRRELVDAKQELEHILGRGVDHFSCPGGRWDPRVAQIARDAGYRSVATSRIGRNGPAADPFRLARVAVLRGTSENDFARLCSSNALLSRRARDLVLSTAKGALGNSLYQKVRRGLFQRR